MPSAEITSWICVSELSIIKHSYFRPSDNRLQQLGLGISHLQTANAERLLEFKHALEKKIIMLSATEM